MKKLLEAIKFVPSGERALIPELPNTSVFQETDEIITPTEHTFVGVLEFAYCQKVKCQNQEDLDHAMRASKRQLASVLTRDITARLVDLEIAIHESSASFDPKIKEAIQKLRDEVCW